MEVRIESGMEMAMISVLRQLPRNSRIMTAVRHAAIIASRITPFTASRTNTDWSASGSILQRRRQRAAEMRGSSFAHLLHDVQRGDRSHLHHRQQRAALAVAPHDVGLRRKPVAHVRHVAHVDGRVAAAP